MLQKTTESELQLVYSLCNEWACKIWDELDKEKLKYEMQEVF